MVKKNLYITIVGQTMTGKTGLMKLFIKTLKDNHIEVVPVWGIDGEPAGHSDEFEQKRINAIANKTKVIIAEHQSGRRTSGTEIESLDDLSIQVLYDNDKGYGVRLVIMGQQLEKWFGSFSVSKDRARGIAARLSAELDLDVHDLIPREYEWVQPR